MSLELSPRGTMAVLSSMLDKTHVFPGPIDEDGNNKPSEVQLCGFSGSAHGPCQGQAHEQTCMKMNNSIRGCSARTHPQIELQIRFFEKDPAHAGLVLHELCASFPPCGKRSRKKSLIPQGPCACSKELVDLRVRSCPSFFSKPIALWEIKPTTRV